jgi:hypothetical protein
MFVYVRLVSQLVGMEPSLWIGQSPWMVHESGCVSSGSVYALNESIDLPRGPEAGLVSQTWVCSSLAGER